MIYVWKIANDYPESLVGAYDRERGPDRFCYKQGKKIDELPASPPRFYFNAKKSEIHKFNDLANNAMIPLVCAGVAGILNSVCPKEVQLIATEVVCKDGLLEGYHIVVATYQVRGLDHSKSKYKTMRNIPAILRFELAVYRHDCLGALSIARDEEYLSNLLVSEQLMNALSGFDDLGIYSTENFDWS